MYDSKPPSIGYANKRAHTSTIGALHVWETFIHQVTLQSINQTIEDASATVFGENKPL